MEVKWESRSDQERLKEERTAEWDWSSSKAFFRFCFFVLISSMAAEIVSAVVVAIAS